MIINLAPQRRDDILTISKQGDALTINGITYDFSDVTEGRTVDRSQFLCQWLASDVSRVSGDIELTLIAPHAADASIAARFPTPIVNPADGIIELPE